ncbi:MAG: adenylyl-sulfate kinase [Deltaproteobacteria bacterium]|nr:adenylyl-sulfate kinase [Deltaproteobacteria bacterium]
MPPHITPHPHRITKTERSALKGHRPAALWFTGLSGSGKSTIANAVEQRLVEHHRAHTYLLDGDNLRTGLNRDLGFGEEARRENIRRFGAVARLFVDSGLIVLAALISPFQQERDSVRALFAPGEFIEVFVDCPLDLCETRDPKGLYQKARTGEIPQFTGISSPYERPQHPEVILDSGALTVDTCADVVLAFLLEQGLLNPKR